MNTNERCIVPAFPERSVFERALRIMLLSALVGVLAGLGTSVFFALIHVFMQLAAFGRGLTGPRFTFLVPVAGMLATAVVLKTLGEAEFGHGFPDVIRAVTRRRSRIDASLTLRKMLASALCIAWGGVVGRIGPVSHIGAMLGSFLGQAFHLPAHVLKLLLGCGAAAGISASFNAPLAGVLFASEVVLRKFDAEVIVPLVIASVIGASIPRPIIGERIMFDIPVFRSLGAVELPLFALLGILCGLLSILFIKSLAIQYRHARKFKIGRYGRAISAGLVIGLVGMAFPEILQINHGMTTAFLHGEMDAWLLLAVALLLPVMTGLTLAGGGSGGVFAPSLAMGAALGGGFGRLLRFLPWDVSEPGAYAVVGAAAVLAGAVKAPITSMLLIMEVTGNHTMLLPLMAASVISIFLSRSYTDQSVLSVTSSDRGSSDTEWIDLLRDIYVDEIMGAAPPVIPAGQAISELHAYFHERPPYDQAFVVESNGRLTGVLNAEMIAATLAKREHRHARARDIAITERFLLMPESDLLGAFHEFGIRSIPELPVVNNPGERILLGTVKRDVLLKRYQDEKALRRRI